MRIICDAKRGDSWVLLKNPHYTFFRLAVDPKGFTWGKNQGITCSKTRMTVGNLVEEVLRPSFEVGWAEMPRASVCGKEAMRKEKVFAEIRSDDEKRN